MRESEQEVRQPYKIRWTKQALRQLDEICAYWVERNTSEIYANKLYNLIVEATQGLKQFPYSGVALREYKGRKLLITSNYILVYRLIEDYIYIMALTSTHRLHPYR